VAGLSVHSIAANPGCFSRRVSCHAKSFRRRGIRNFHAAAVIYRDLTIR
jgi:hypothetical protein